MGGPRDREFQKLRASLLNEFVARGTAQLKLRPTGRVALEWARLLTADIPGAHLYPVAGEGHFLAYRRWDDVLAPFAG